MYVNFSSFFTVSWEHRGRSSKRHRSCEGCCEEAKGKSAAAWRMGIGLGDGEGGSDRRPDPFLICYSQAAPAWLSINVWSVLSWVEGKANKMDF